MKIAPYEKFRFGRAFEEYLRSPNPKTVEQVEPIQTHNGKVLADFDDFRDDIIEYISGGHNVTA